MTYKGSESGHEFIVLDTNTSVYYFFYIPRDEHSETEMLGAQKHCGRWIAHLDLDKKYILPDDLKFKELSPGHECVELIQEFIRKTRVNYEILFSPNDTDAGLTKQDTTACRLCNSSNGSGDRHCHSGTGQST